MFECPSCDRNDFSSETGVRIHHSKIHNESISEKETRKCVNCGTQVERYPSRFGEETFCGTECRNLVLSERQEGNGNVSTEETVKAKISQSKKGDTHSLETKKQMSKNRRGEDNPFYGKEHTDETKRKISKSESGCDPPPALHIEVIETGHTVRSGWEAEIDKMLHEMGIEYGYETRRIEYGNGRSYLPDFVVGNTLIEVKGFADENSIQKSKAVCESDYRYIVVGGNHAKRLSCDVFVEWENKSKLKEIL